jgi:hypothetical protein
VFGWVRLEGRSAGGKPRTTGVDEGGGIAAAATIRSALVTTRRASMDRRGSQRS